MYSPSKYTYHMFLTDKSGKSVVVEWLDGETHVVEDNAVTNITLYGCEAPENEDYRYAKMHRTLEKSNKMDKESAMALLAEVSQGKKRTCWSAVYDVDSFTAEACFGSDYT